MYLLKFDEVEVIAEKDNWLHIKYYGKKNSGRLDSEKGYYYVVKTHVQLI